jgi:hypothetical protein
MLREILMIGTVGAFILPSVCTAIESVQVGSGSNTGQYADLNGSASSQWGAPWILAANDVADAEKLKKEKMAKEEAERRIKARHEEAEKHRKALEERRARHERDQHERDKDKHHEERGEHRQAVPGMPRMPVAAPAVNPAPPVRVATPPVLAPKPVAPATTAPVAAGQSLMVRTFPASGYNAVCAVLNGYAADPGKSGKVWFEWGKTTALGQATGAEIFSGEKSVGHRICWNALGVKIFFRAVAQSGASLAYGDIATFQ